MEDRLSPRGAPALPLLALAGLLVITAAWWALALWPTPGSGWVERLRTVCFGTRPDGLPTAAGWLLLVGEPAGMFGMLILVWGRELRQGLAAARNSLAGRAVLTLGALAVVAGLTAAAARVRGAGEPFDVAPAASELVPLDRPAPALTLTSQRGARVSLEQLRGRVVLVGFVYGHCQTLCPVTAQAMLRAARAASSAPVVVLVTLDPWRDTPDRLPALAAAWGLGPDQYVLGGSPGEVEAALERWEVSRSRNLKTGEIVHSASVRVVDRSGRLRFAAPADAAALGRAIGLARSEAR